MLEAMAHRQDSAITGVPTSSAAFIGNFSRGPMDEVVRVTSASAFERAFGGLRADSLCSYAVPQFFLNGGRTAWIARVEGQEGTVATAEELVTALPRLDVVDPLNILCIPDTDRLTDVGAAQVITAATAYAAGRRAFYVVDPPNGEVVRKEPPEIQAWLEANGTLRHPNTAAYWPRPRIPDPIDELQLRAVPASGTIAGLYARTDEEHGVWKAPAGLEANLRGVQQLERVITDAENAVLNPLGLNCLRFFTTTGYVCWGARTLEGADRLASEWKYVPVRRLALFLEESIDRGTRFAVFEPNDEPLWSQIRQKVGAFLHDLFGRGAFQGRTANQAYLVKCDSETTTQADIDRNNVNILVGFAPLKPAEFVTIQISRPAGRTAVSPEEPSGR